MCLKAIAVVPDQLFIASYPVLYCCLVELNKNAFTPHLRCRHPLRFMAAEWSALRGFLRFRIYIIGRLHSREADEGADLAQPLDQHYFAKVLLVLCRSRHRQEFEVVCIVGRIGNNQNLVLWAEEIYITLITVFLRISLLLNLLPDLT